MQHNAAPALPARVVIPARRHCLDQWEARRHAFERRLGDVFVAIDLRRRLEIQELQLTANRTLLRQPVCAEETQRRHLARIHAGRYRRNIAR